MSNTPETQINKVPRHIAIIPDGNRRWARENNLPSLEGHKKGALNFEQLMLKARELGVECFTGWFFSTENWSRAKEESDYLFKLASELIKYYKVKFLKEKVRFVHLGRKDRIPENVLKELTALEEETKHFSPFIVGVCMDYGGHDELLRTVNTLVAKNLPITKENIESHLDTKFMPMPDLIIRTGGEQRLSGFMSWQSEYAEFAFPKKYFPDFSPEDLAETIKDFANRDRRFGGDSKKSKIT